MSETTGNWNTYHYSLRERFVPPSASSRADNILVRAERREISLASSRVLEKAKMDRLDRLALSFGTIMVLGPLFAAYVGSLFYSG